MHKPKGHITPPVILNRARDLRHPMTPAETRVWHAVRDRQLGFKIRRQVPMGRFIMDFYCSEAKLAIEIDGDGHAEPDQVTYDAARTRWLEKRGCAVIRFQARQVERDLPAVLEAICIACEARGSMVP